MSLPADEPSSVLRLRSERIVVPGGVVAGEVVLRGRRIVEVAGESGLAEGGAGAREVVDAGSAWVLPGFIDTHVHGGGGARFETGDEDEVRAVSRFHARHGTTALLATLVSAPLDELCERTAALAPSLGAIDGGATVLGTHLEGPFLNRARPGAMDPATFVDPSAAAVDRLLGCGGVRWMTVAPELPGGVELVRSLTRRGVVAAVGHSEASMGEMREAVTAGAVAVTHLFNAMPGLGHRAPGVVGATLDMPELSPELICDGVHVDPAVLRIAVRVAGVERVRLVTDAMAAAGMPDGGAFALGTASVRVHDGRAVLAAAPDTIAGSILTMDTAVRNAVAWLGLTVPEVSVMASANPARVLGLGGRKGEIVAGADADLVVLDADRLEVAGVMVEGRWCGGRPESLRKGPRP